MSTKNANDNSRTTWRNRLAGCKEALWEDLKIKWRWSMKQKGLVRELVRLLLTVVIFGLCMGLMVMAQIQSDLWFDRYNRKRNMAALKQGLAEPKGIEIWSRDPLHDRLFDILPDWESRRGWLPDLLLISLIVFTVTFAILFPAKKRIPWQAVVVLRRFLWCLAVLYIFRMCSFMVTTVPNPVKNCMPKYIPDAHNSAQAAADYLALMGKMMSGSVTACTDNIYSGHTSLITLLVGMCLVYGGRLLVQAYAVIHGSCAVISIVWTRLHYTVDVLIALFVASFVFAIYHFLLVIFVDGQLMAGLNRVNTTSAGRAIQDASLLAEHSLLSRMVWVPVGKVLWWIDGLDIRVGPYTVDHLTREREERKLASLLNSPTIKQRKDDDPIDEHGKNAVEPNDNGITSCPV